MRIFSIVLAVLFLNYLLPTEVPRVIAENVVVKMAVHDAIQTLPSSESLAARALNLPVKKFQHFVFSIPAQSFLTRGVLGSYLESQPIPSNHFARTTRRSRAPPV